MPWDPPPKLLIVIYYKQEAHFACPPVASYMYNYMQVQAPACMLVKVFSCSVLQHEEVIVTESG